MRILVRISVILAVSACGSRAKTQDPIVARVGTVPIRASDLLARAPAMSQLFRSKEGTNSTEAEKRRYLLNVLVKEEAVVQEGQRRGYDRDPGLRNEIMARVMDDEVKASTAPPELSAADIERYYIDHREEMTKPRQVRVLQILTRDRTVAQAAATRARIAERSDIDAFQDLVAKYSDDRLSRAYGGDMGFIDRESSGYPKAVVQAAFALANLYDVSDPVASERGFHVLKLVQRIPAYVPALSEAAPQIRDKLRRLLAERKKVTLTQALLHRTQLVVDDDALLQVPFPSELLSPPPATGLP
jgi:parvulin-like peptidyl-prolyl isomerase